MSSTRYQMTNVQRKALRHYHRLNPKLNQRQLQAWFEGEYGCLLKQSTISHSLSKAFTYLDKDTPLLQPRKRRHEVSWPALESALLQWVVRAQLELPLTDSILRIQAASFWQRLPEYKEMEVPTFSNGWLYKFKGRHNIRTRTRHGEAGDVNLTAIDEQLTAVKAIAGQFLPSNVYNCDETGLFYKRVPDRGLSTIQLPGNKSNKARLTLHLCCNADGSHQLPLWIIGQSAHPRCFGAANVHFSALNCAYKSNKKAWMNHQLMIKWLYWFQRQVGGKKVLLIMDNFSAHTLAVDTIQEQEPLSNITVIYLPPNSTSKTQPLDQGIIKSFKTKYQTRWLTYMLQEYENKRNPLRTMNILKAIRWAIHSWEEVSSITIQNCWYHSGLLEKPVQHTPEEIEEMTQIASILQQLAIRNHISEPTDIDAFISPPEEQVSDNPDDIFEDIAQQFDPEESEESEDEEIEAKIRHDEALYMLQRLSLYELQQEDGQSKLVRHYDYNQDLIVQRKTAERQQQLITTYFT